MLKRVLYRRPFHLHLMNEWHQSKILNRQLWNQAFILSVNDLERGDDMNLCEICGAKDGLEENTEETFQSVMLHICENCRNDRKNHSFDD